MVGMKNKEAVTPQVNQEKGCPMEVLAPHPREGRWPQDRNERWPESSWWPQMKPQLFGPDK